MTTLFPLIVTSRIETAADFYRDVLGVTTMIDVGWYVQLQHPDSRSMQIALLRDDHDSVPSHTESPPPE